MNSPKLDHTYESAEGKYLLLNLPANYSTQGKPDFALTSLVTLPGTEDHCLYLWYYEDGEGDFSITVNKEEVVNKTVRLAYTYQSTIESRARWNAIKAFIGAELVNSQVKLSIHYQPSVARLQHYHVFALDDLSVRSSYCSHQYDYTYTFTDGYEDLNVEFLQPVSASIGNIVSPAKHTVSTSAPIPATDHTTNSPTGEYFLFTNRAGDVATTYIDTIALMNIPPLRNGQYLCLRFAYQLSGNASLNVHSMAVDSYQYTASPAVWVSSNNQ